MTIQVTDILRDPIGMVSAGTEIRVTALTSEGSTLRSLIGMVVTGDDGAYSFELVNGRHSIEVNFSKEYHLVGEVTITSSTPSPTTLAALLNM